MIRFKCSNCGQGFKVSDQHAGRQTKCPKCNNTVMVPTASSQQKPPSQPDIIKFRCPSCNQKIGLAKHYAGKTVRCAKCKNPLQVPGAPRPVTPPRPAKPKHETEVLRAGQEDALSTEGLWGDMEPLRLAEESAPSVEMPQQAPAEQGLTTDDLAAYDSALRGGGSYQDTVGEAPKRTRVGLFIGLGSLITLLVAGAVFLIFIFSVARGFSEGLVESPEAEELVESFIYLIEDKKTDEAKDLFREDLRGDIEDIHLERFAKKVAKSEIVEVECSQIRAVEEEQGRKLFVQYDVYFMDQDRMETLEDFGNQVQVIALVFEDSEGLRLESIAASDFSGGSASVGRSGYEELKGEMISAFADELGPGNFGLPCSVLVILVVMVLVVGIIQTVAVWTIFEKAGQPGWAILVPFYNMWVWAVVGDRPGWVGLAACCAGFIPVPYVGSLVELGLWIFITIGVAKAFDRGVGFGLGLCFLPIVFYPILAFDV